MPLFLSVYVFVYGWYLQSLHAYHVHTWDIISNSCMHPLAFGISKFLCTFLISYTCSP